MVCFFYLSSKRKRKFKHLVQTKAMGENNITNIMKVSLAGTSLKESEKKVYESLCKEAKIVSSGHIANVTGRYDEADEEELRLLLQEAK